VFFSAGNFVQGELVGEFVVDAVWWVGYCGGRLLALEEYLPALRFAGVGAQEPVGT
jgi:hypothetical protein